MFVVVVFVKSRVKSRFWLGNRGLCVRTSELHFVRNPGVDEGALKKAICEFDCGEEFAVAYSLRLWKQGGIGGDLWRRPC